MSRGISRLTKDCVVAALGCLAVTVAVAVAGEESSIDRARESLRQTELAFAATVKNKDMAAFLSFVDDEAIFVAGAPLRGKAAVAAAWASLFEDDAPDLVWHPMDVEVVESRGLGITRGPYTSTVRQPDGSTASSGGTFFSVWRRQTDDSWKILFDSGSLPAPAEASQ